MKKILLFLGLLVASCGALFAEDITITTYYPSPYGSYNSLITDKLGVGDNDGDTSLDSGDVPTNSGDAWIKGNVGIGTTTPRGHFDVDGLGDIWLTDDGLQAGTQSLFLPGHIYMAPYSTSNIVYLQARRSNNSGTTALRLRTYNAGTLTEAVHIAGNGNVGIGGVTNPQALLTVNNGVGGGIAIGPTPYAYSWPGTSGGANGVLITSNDIMFDRNGEVYISNMDNGGSSALTFTTKGGSGSASFMTISSNGNISGSHGNYHVASDVRLKKEIATIPNALRKILSLRGVNFKWKDASDDKLHMGLIAQEVEKIIPEVVHIADDKMKTKAVEYEYMVALLIEGIKEQQKEINELKEKVKSLEAVK